MKKKQNNELYELRGNPSVSESMPITLQHLLAVVVGNISPALIIAAAANLGPDETAMLIRCSMVTSGVTVLIQTYGIWKFGARLPVVIGINFAFIPVVLMLVERFGLASVFGAQLISGFVLMIFGYLMKNLSHLFPSLVTGVGVLTTGISLYPVAIDYMAGGANNPGFGDPQNWIVAIFTATIVFLIEQFGRGQIKVLAMLIATIAGYILSIFLGMVDFTDIASAAMFSGIKPLPFPMEFRIEAIVILVITHIIMSITFVGGLASITVSGLDREPTAKEISGGIQGNGLATIITSFFGGLPIGIMGQNAGIIASTKVTATKVISLLGYLYILMGLTPKLSAVMTSIPYPVLGGATISVFAVITVNGIKLLTQEKLTSRNTAIMGLSLALGVGLWLVDGALDQFPQMFQILAGGSPAVSSTLLAFILNIIIPEDK